MLIALVAGIQRGAAPVGPVWLATLVAGLAGVAGYGVARLLGTGWPIQVVLVVTVLLAWHATAARPRGRFLVVAAAMGVVSFLFLDIINVAQNRMVNPLFWDYTVFWILGRAVHVGGASFDPAVLVELGRSVGAPDSFFREARPFYPPPFYLLVGPLGMLDRAAAAVPWHLVQVNAMIFAIIAIGRVIFGREGFPGMVLAALLVLTMPAATATLNIGQTNFVLLGLGALLFRAGDRWGSGVAIALGAVVKPFFGAFLLIPLARRHVRALAAAVVAGLVLFIGSAIILGPAVWFDYITIGLPQLSSYPFSQSVNQSLPAGIMRSLGGAPDLILLAVAVVMVTIVVFVSQLLAAAESARASVPQGLPTALTLVTILLLYPATLGHYYLLLVLPLAYLWAQRSDLRVSPVAVAIVIGVVWGLVGADSGRISLLAGITAAAFVVWVMAAALGRLPDPERVPRPIRRLAAAAIEQSAAVGERVRTKVGRRRGAT